MTDPILPALQLKGGEDRRLRAGHLWVFSNEIDVARTPLTGFSSGDAVRLLDASGRMLGTGYVNPSTLIAARLVDRGGHALDTSLIVHRLNVALALRERRYPGAPFHRLVFGESDGLPGLVLDRFGDVIVGQTTTAGMDRLKPQIAEAVRKVLDPAALLWKNDAGARALENLPSEVALAFGTLDGPLRVEEGGLVFEVDALGGQKTGWFYDQRANRDQLAPWVGEGVKVLDLFSYAGAWGLRAAAFGAAEVTCVDASQAAVETVRSNAARNRLSERVEAVCADAFEFLKAARAERRRWDVVVVDPPAFIKKRKDLREGTLAYRRINEMAMQVLERDGLLVSCSCSHHMGREALLREINAGARHLDRQVQVLQTLQQGPDHPVQAAIPETEYLKGYICRVLPS